jgi:hypothetical protein
MDIAKTEVLLPLFFNQIIQESIMVCIKNKE